VGRNPPTRRAAPGEGVPDWRTLGTGTNAVLALGAARACARTLAEVAGAAAGTAPALAGQGRGRTLRYTQVRGLEHAREVRKIGRNRSQFDLLIPLVADAPSLRFQRVGRAGDTRRTGLADHSSRDALERGDCRDSWRYADSRWTGRRQWRRATFRIMSGEVSTSLEGCWERDERNRAEATNTPQLALASPEAAVPGAGLSY